jgi:hypothetical protein
MRKFENLKLINRVIKKSDDSVTMVLDDMRDNSLDDLTSSINASNNERYINKELLSPEHLLLMLIHQVDQLTDNYSINNNSKHLEVTRVNLAY